MYTEEELNKLTLEYFCDSLAVLETYEELERFFQHINKEEYKKILKMAQEKVRKSGK